MLAAALVLSACSADSSTAPASQVSAKSTPSMFVPTASAKALIGVVDGTYAVTVDPTKDNSLNLGPNHLDIPAYAICDLRFSGYGAAYWDRSCQPQVQPLVLTVVIKNSSSANPSIDFYPAMRFNPYRTVQLYMYAPNVSINDAINWKMLYCPDLGGCFDESANDASLATKIDYTNNVLFRRVKHFSGYTVAE